MVQPQVAYGAPASNVTVMQVGHAGSQKSVGLAVLLAFLFGPFGTFYGSVVGGAVLLASSVLFGWLIVPIPFIYIGSIIWAAAGASQHNSQLGSTAVSVTSQTPGMVAPAPVMPTSAPVPPQALAQSTPETQTYGQPTGFQPAASAGGSPWSPASNDEQIVDAEVLAVESGPENSPEAGWWAN